MKIAIAYLLENKRLASSFNDITYSKSQMNKNKTIDEESELKIAKVLQERFNLRKQK